MGCRCSERRIALASVARSLASGNAAAARHHAGTLTRSAVEDMASLMLKSRRLNLRSAPAPKKDEG